MAFQTVFLSQSARNLYSWRGRVEFVLGSGGIRQGFNQHLAPLPELFIGMYRVLFSFWLLPLVLGADSSQLPPPLPESVVTNRSSIVVARHPGATISFSPSVDGARQLVRLALRSFSPDRSTASAWRSVLEAKDIVGFKVTSSPGPIAGTRPIVVRAIIESLREAGHSAAQIVIWDRRKADLVEAGYARLAEELGVRCVGIDEAGWDEAKGYESPVPGRLVHGDFEFGRREPLTGGHSIGRMSHLSRLLTRDLTKIVTVAPLLNHNQVGVNGHIASLGLGSVDNTLRFEDSSERLAEALPEICALDDIFPKLALCFTDALLCQYRGEERTLLHYAIATDELWLGTDPVALDVLSLRELAAARQRSPVDGEKPFKTEVYRNCELLELGVADLKRIELRRIP